MKKLIFTFILLISFSYGFSQIGSWSLSGNSISTSNFLGTTNNTDLAFKRNNVLSGNIGLNNTSFGYQTYQNAGGSHNTAFGASSLKNSLGGSFSGNTGIGVAAGSNLFNGSDNIMIGMSSGIHLTGGNLNTIIGTYTGQNLTTGSYNTIIGAQITGLPSNLSNHILIADGSGNIRIHVNNEGKVKFGNVSTPGDYRLYVEKGILTEKVKISLKSSSDWADYVFDENYELLPLQDLEIYIKENKHLPGIPSATQLVEEGIDIGNMQAKQMEKIEELTLYIIELKKEIDLLKTKIFNDEK